MKVYIEERCKEIAKYIIKTRCTCKDCARKFGISETTVHQDMRKRLPKIDNKLYLQVSNILDLNKAEAFLRGGLATKEKYEINKI
ncbi:sporulation transcriptional regulator SpoIIID [Cellulosilyticum lentocellum]|uniref:Sporulation transcriptional regulator SpoIIID n=1 Tax=Cellulosilyticum lentocellum (strain ATCC 49066 / DSM 5427 / NCIMB 11756 / RHM5) TaxID=642492 RepID=F2JK55_CELLD|nr:sporulation transcriptional regulator SpoIIID [Cellulosilyticum lentocellum]ADZ84470.1 sporulation transcriptional regulator SpoIIID [Cellulosilyticum lentocellum DSM 5427]